MVFFLVILFQRSSFLVLHTKLPCPPSSKFTYHGILNFFLNSRILLIWVRTTIDNIFLDDLRSMILGPGLQLNELPPHGVSISVILYGPSQLGSRALLLYRTFLKTRSPVWIIFTFKLKYQAVHCWYTTTLS